MGYEINSTWTKLREKDIKKLNKIIDDEYCNELEIGRKLHLMNILIKAFEDELENFRFHHVLKFMKDHKWTWFFYENEKSVYRIPTKEDIINRLKNEYLKHGLFHIIELKEKDYIIDGGGVSFMLGLNEGDAWCRINFDIAHYVDD